MIENVKKILAPIDFSEYSFAATRSAWSLARDCKAELHLLHVVAPHFAILADAPAESAREAAMVEEAEEELARIRKDEMENSAKVATQAVVGPPVVKICEYAKQHDIDLIVVSTHGRTGLNHMLIGSVTEKLARNAPCSVLVVRARR